MSQKQPVEYALISNIGKTIRTLGFHNNKHLLDQSGLDVSSRGVFRILSNI